MLGIASAGCGSTDDHGRRLGGGTRLGINYTWLGLDYNSDAGVGPQDQFSIHGISYDRLGIDPTAGENVSHNGQLRSELATSFAAGMIPDVVILPGDNSNPRVCNGSNPGGWCLATSAADIAAYARGFARTASSILRWFPGQQVLFESMNEPWIYGEVNGRQLLPGRASVAQFAKIVAAVLPAAVTAKVPLSEIYIPAATGTLNDGTPYIPDLYQAEPCLAPGHGPCGSAKVETPIEGWTLHPYGLPLLTTEGIDSVPGERRQMRSGKDNIVVSEIGFCEIAIDTGADCGDNLQDIVGTAQQVSLWLTETLDQALAMHRAGWLKAVILWSRTYPWQAEARPRTTSGFSMENLNGTLTPAGKVLVAFADQYGDV